MTVLLKVVGNHPAKHNSSGSSINEGEASIVDGAARREIHERGLGKLWWK